MSSPIPCHRRIRPRRHNIAGEPSSQGAHLLSLSLPFTSNRTSLSHNSACLLPVILLLSLHALSWCDVHERELFFAAFCVLLYACTHPTRTRCTRATVAVGKSRSRSSLFENSECEERGSGVCAWRGLLVVVLVFVWETTIAIAAIVRHCTARPRRGRRAEQRSMRQRQRQPRSCPPRTTYHVPPRTTYHVPQRGTSRQMSRSAMDL